MDVSSSIVGSSLAELTTHYEVITNNMANSNTAGYKRRVVAQSLAGPAEPTAEPTDLSGATLDGQVVVDFGQGQMVRTGRSLDLALDGQGAFFVIETPEGPLYTRNGVFRLNAQRQLVDATGCAVGGEGGPMVFPPQAGPGNIQVAGDGTVSAGGVSVGKLRVVKFDDTSQLIAVGSCCFKAPEGLAPGGAAEAAVVQGFQEGANVNVVQELVNLIMVTRMYEANLKTVAAQDQNLESILKVALA